MIDSTLGFAEMEGFRNGSCHPFLPYDLDSDSVIPIWEIPLIMMDGTLSFYRDRPAHEAMEAISPLIDSVREHRGMASILFHNTSYDAHEFPGWSVVFEETVAMLQNGGVHCDGMYNSLTAWLGGAEPQTVAAVISNADEASG